MRESEIILTLGAADPTIPDEVLEDHMFAVLDAVEGHASEALGPVASVDFDKHAIELAFSLCHETQAQAQQQIAEVVNVIEHRTQVSLGTTDSSVRDRDPDDTASLALIP